MGSERIGVLHLIDTLEPGGAERVAVELANHLPRERFRPFLGTTRREGPLAELVRPDVGRLSLNRRRTLDLGAMWRLAAFVRENRIAIVHAHSSSLFLAALAASRSALVWHDHFGRHAQEERPAWPYSLALRRAAGVIAVDEDLARWVRERLGVEAGRVWYVPNFTPQAASSSPIPDLPGERGRRIACVANFRAQKDHLNLVRAFARLSRDEQAHLLLVGSEVEPECAARVRAEISALGLEARISMLGRRTDVPALLRGCEVGVLSSASEGFPLTLLEYGAAGLAAVATRVGRCAELLEEGAAGLLVPPRDPAALAAALLVLLREPERRATLGERLRERVRTRYSAATVIEQVERVYHTVLSQGRMEGR